MDNIDQYWAQCETELATQVVMEIRPIEAQASEVVRNGVGDLRLELEEESLGPHRSTTKQLNKGKWHFFKSMSHGNHLRWYKLTPFFVSPGELKPTGALLG